MESLLSKHQLSAPEFLQALILIFKQGGLGTKMHLGSCNPVFIWAEILGGNQSICNYWNVFQLPPILTFVLQTDYCESYLASAKGNTMCCSSAGRRHHQGVCLTLDAPPAKWFWTVSKSTAPQRNLHSSGAKMWSKIMIVVMVEAQSSKLTHKPGCILVHPVSL